ncbi:GTP cyclohydrolase II [Cryptococcus neoformans]|nr:GTP cyclohydrolase II [Cryptococcus neoformans var. grubii Bt1]OXG35344.1 GTP cyclohydrolase II [Cryptococcus neoformans var. grubii Ze90-1]OXH41503.1 GTP cyclohydrolase II [Cryptococcus neoformans var. grubii]
MTHSPPTQADLDVLSLLTSDQSAIGTLPFQSTRLKSAPQPVLGKKKLIPRRDSPLDALMISAVLAGSGPITRHHFGHGLAKPGSYSSCDQSRPSSPAAPRVIMKSIQAPRSERLRLEHEARAAFEKGAVDLKSSEDQLDMTKALSPQAQAAYDRASKPLSPRTSSVKDPSKRRMSIDPVPLTQTLQRASSSSFNFFHPHVNAVPQSIPGRIQVRCMARTRVPSPHGELFLHLYHNSHDAKEHLAILLDPIQLDAEVRAAAPRSRKEIRSKSLDAVWRDGETEMERIVRGAYTGRLKAGATMSNGGENEPSGIEGVEDIKPLVRIHSECFTGETIGSMRCDCGEQLDEAIHQIAEPQRIPVPLSAPNPYSGDSLSTSATFHPETPAHTHVPGRGVVIYLRQEGRGIGLLEKIRAYNLQDLGHDTVTANLMLGHGADERKYDIAAEILRDLGLAEEGIRLLTNNPEKVRGLASEGVKVVERVGMTPRSWQCGDDHSHENKDGVKEEKEYDDWRMRRAGVGLIGAGMASGPELEKYLRTKVERMGHIIDIPKNI